MELSRAVAVAEADGPQAGLKIVDAPRASRTTTTCTRPAPISCAASAATDDARAAYDRALALVHDDAERRLLERKRDDLN